MPSWTDQVQAWAALGALIVAIVSAWFVVVSLRQAARAIRSQSQSSDMAAVLVLWDKLDQHWVRFKAVSSDQERAFEFGQLISYYEMACTLFNDRVFSTVASRTLREHLNEILPVMRANPSFILLFDELQTRSQTFENIRAFCGETNLPEQGAQSRMSRLKDLFTSIRRGTAINARLH